MLLSWECLLHRLSDLCVSYQLLILPQSCLSHLLGSEFKKGRTQTSDTRPIISDDDLTLLVSWITKPSFPIQVHSWDIWKTFYFLKFDLKECPKFFCSRWIYSDPFFVFVMVFPLPSAIFSETSFISNSPFICSSFCMLLHYCHWTYYIWCQGGHYRSEEGAFGLKIEEKISDYSKWQIYMGKYRGTALIIIWCWSAFKNIIYDKVWMCVSMFLLTWI
jgi:hypothetical protein